MSERGKSILLIFLVLLSIYLTYQLWFGRKPLEEVTEDPYEPVYFEEARPLTEVIAPARIILWQESAVYQFTYSHSAYTTLWSGVSKLLQRLSEAEPFPAEQAQGAGMPFLALYFHPPLPVGQGSPWLKEDTERELEEVVFIQSNDQYWLQLRTVEGIILQQNIPRQDTLILQQTVGSLRLDSVVPYRELDTEELVSLLGVPIDLAGSIFVPAKPVQMEELVLREEELNRELLVRTFFVDRSLVRVVTERDGSIIYTDGEKGLSLGSGLTFSHPQLEQSPATYTYSAALQTASRLLSYYGGWKEYLRLESLGRESKSGRLSEPFLACWRSYYQGWPFFGEPGVSITFNDSGLVGYRRCLLETAYSTGNLLDTRSYSEALPAALAILEQQADLEEGKPLLLEEMVLGYALNPDTAQPWGIPVWAIRISGRELLLDAVELTELEGVAL